MLGNRIPKLAGNARKKKREGSGKTMGSCMLPHEMSGLDSAGHRLDLRSQRFYEMFRKGPREAPSLFSQGNVCFPSLFCTLDLCLRFHFKRFCYEGTLKTTNLGESFFKCGTWWVIDGRAGIVLGPEIISTRLPSPSLSVRGFVKSALAGLEDSQTLCPFQIDIFLQT